MLKENETFLNRSDVVKKEEGTIEFSVLLSIFFFKIFINFDRGVGGKRDYAVLVLREAECEDICHELSQYTFAQDRRLS